MKKSKKIKSLKKRLNDLRYTLIETELDSNAWYEVAFHLSEEYVWMLYERSREEIEKE